MQHQQNPIRNHAGEVAVLSRGERFGEWVQDPMGSVVVASLATIGSFGIVLSGMWAISLALN